MTFRQMVGYEDYEVSDIGIEKPNIISALKGRTKTSGGMTWRYAE